MRRWPRPGLSLTPASARLAPDQNNFYALSPAQRLQHNADFQSSANRFVSRQYIWIVIVRPTICKRVRVCVSERRCMREPQVAHLVLIVAVSVQGKWKAHGNPSTCLESATDRNTANHTDKR